VAYKTRPEIMHPRHKRKSRSWSQFLPMFQQMCCPWHNLIQHGWLFFLSWFGLLWSASSYLMCEWRDPVWQIAHSTIKKMLLTQTCRWWWALGKVVLSSEEESGRVISKIPPAIHCWYNIYTDLCACLQVIRPSQILFTCKCTWYNKK